MFSKKMYKCVAIGAIITASSGCVANPATGEREFSPARAAEIASRVRDKIEGSTFGATPAGVAIGALLTLAGVALSAAGKRKKSAPAPAESEGKK